jgi:hypothetical protein
MPRLGFTYFGGIGDCLRIILLFHGRLLHLLNAGDTPVRWNDGGSAGSRLVEDQIISRVPGLRAARADEEFVQLLDYPRWHRFFRWTRTPIRFRLSAEEDAALPRLSDAKPSVAICPHQNGLACKKLPNDAVNEVLRLLRAKFDADYYVFDEKLDPSALDAPCIGGLNLAQAMVLMGRFDAGISIDSWQKYILGMWGKPQTSLVVDFRVNESYTYETTAAAVYQEFFRWRVPLEATLGFTPGLTDFRWKTAAEVEPRILAEHLLSQLRATGKYTRFLK